MKPGKLTDQEIREMIKSRGIKIAWVAKKLKVTHSYLSRCFNPDMYDHLSNERKEQIVDLVVNGDSNR